jgi:replication-associated recombination protein RarA
MKEAWTEKYRPKTLADYVFTDPEQKTLIESWVRDQYIPDILLSGSAGTGKTTLAKVLINELGIEGYDILEANGSKEARKIEWVTDKLEPFCQTMPFGKIKVVLIDEADYMNINSVQPALRNLIENYSYSVRFILTCNYPNKIMPALQSRCEQGRIHISKPDVTEFTARAATVLMTENIDFDLDTLDTYVKATYPDLRRCLHMIQKKSVTGTLSVPSENDTLEVRDWRLDAVDLFKSGRITEARRIICTQGSLEDIDSVFRWMYDNLDIWSSTPEGKDEAITAISKGLINVSLVSDQEINLSATLAELTRIPQ